MISFAQFYNKSGRAVETGFLSINNLLEDSPSANASTITNCIIETMDKFSLDSRKLSSFVSDGTAVMTGSRSGVATKLKELNPQLINFHCICHRLALASTHTLSSVSYINSVLKWLSQLWYMFQNLQQGRAGQLDDAVETKSPINRLKEDLQEDGRLGLLDMNASEHQYRGLENLLCNYVDALKANTDKRFQESLPVVSAWSIFDPLKVPNKDHPGFKLYGKRQVQTIAKHFTSSMPANQKGSVQEEMKTEFAKLKYDMLTWKQDLPEECNPSESPCKVTAIEWCLQRICSLSHFYPKISNVTDIFALYSSIKCLAREGRQLHETCENKV